MQQKSQKKIWLLKKYILHFQYINKNKQFINKIFYILNIIYMETIRYNNINKEYKLKNTFNIFWLDLFLLKYKNTFEVVEKESWLIIFQNLNKDKIKDINILIDMITKYIEVRIFLDWSINNLLSIIEKQKQKTFLIKN